MFEFILDYLMYFYLLLGFLIILLFFKLLKKPELGIYMTFFATGILLSPNLPVVREKLTGAEVCMSLTWAALLLRSVNSRRSILLTNIQRNSLLIGGMFAWWIFISFAINGTLYPATMMDSFIETINFIYGYFMFVTVVLMVQNWEIWIKCINAWLWGAVVVSFFGILGLSGHGPYWCYDQITHRVCSTLRTENQVPSFLLPIFVVLMFMIVQRGRRLPERLTLMILLISVFLTTIASGSRTSILMLIAAGLGIIYVGIREAPYKQFNKLMLVRVIGYLIIGFTSYVFLALVGYKGDYSMMTTPAWKRPVILIYEWSQGNRVLDSNRSRELVVVSENIWDNLLIGTGPKNYGNIYGVEEIHNTYAGILFQTGIPGLTLFLMWLLLVVFTGWRSSKRIQIPHQRLIILCMVVGFVLLLLYSLTMFGLRQRNIWLLAGLLVSTDFFIPRSEFLK